jgi:IS605 OrfB family transposase
MRKNKTKKPKDTVRRACKVSLRYMTKTKANKLHALLRRYRGAVNFFIKLCWDNRDLQELGVVKETYSLCTTTHLSARYKNAALRQAFNIIDATVKSAKELDIIPSRPHFTGSAVLDAKFVKIDSHDSCFDLMVSISSLEAGNKIVFPTKKTALLNKWLAKPRAQLVQGCAISEHKLVLWVEFVPEKTLNHTDKAVLGCDIGINKLLVITDGDQTRLVGTDMRKVMAKVSRRQLGSKGRRTAQRARDQFIDLTVKRAINWSEVSIIGIEDLSGLKQGKKPKQSKSFRKTRAPWAYSQVVARIEQHCQANGIGLVKVNPAYTSLACPECNKVFKANRKGENFCCISCGYSNDSDVVGAKNVLVRTLRTLGMLDHPR